MPRDRWAEWVLSGRDGGDDGVLARRLAAFTACRDKVLDNAAVGAGHVVLDVGTGGGLLAFGALDRVGPDGHVIFSDISQDLLDDCRRRAPAGQSSFLRASADDLSALPDGAVDAVVARAAMMYVRRKDRAFAEIFRVLRPGGRLSVFEPISGFAQPESPHLLMGVDVRPVAKLAAKVKAYAVARDTAENYATLDFDERDLLRLCERAGFTGIRLDYTARRDVTEPGLTDDWEVFRKISASPLSAALGEAIEGALAPAEQEALIAHMRSRLAADPATVASDASAYLWATKGES